MTNTASRDSIHTPSHIRETLAAHEAAANRIRLVQSYLDEVALHGLRPDEAFLGADAVAFNEDRADLMVTFEVRDWTAAAVELALSRIVSPADPDSDDFTTEVVWRVELVEVPRILFVEVLESVLRRLANS